MVSANLPKLKKSWQITVNNRGASNEGGSTDDQKTLFELKESLTGFSARPWTVHSSSDSSASGSSDLWLAHTNLVWGTGSHSWIVLEKPNGGAQLLLDLNSASSTELSIYWSPGGNFTGGSASTRATATDEITLQTTSNWFAGESNYNSWIHIWNSADGKHTRVVGTTTSANIPLFWIFDDIENPFANLWTNPEIFCIYSGNVSKEIISSSPVVSNSAKGFDSNAGTFDIVLSGIGNDFQNIDSDGYGWITDQKYAEVTNQLQENGGYPLISVVVASETVGARGVHGVLTDLWWTTSSLESGTQFTHPNSDEKLIKVGDLVLPSNNNISAIVIDTGITSATVLQDRTNNNNDGTFGGSLTEADIVLDSPGGSSSESIEFAQTGTNSSNVRIGDYVTMGNAAELDFALSEPFSISCWAKWSDVNSEVMVSKNGDVLTLGRGYYLSALNLGGNSVIDFLVSHSPPSNRMLVRTTNTLDGYGQPWNNNQWRHIVVTFQGFRAIGANLYVDNVDQPLTDVFDGLATTPSNTYPFNIGARDNGFNPFSGRLDEVAVFGKKLSAAEVAEIFNNGVPVDIQTLSVSNSLLGYWFMGSFIDESVRPTVKGTSVDYETSLTSDEEVNNYLMRGLDSGASGPNSPAYIYWLSKRVPDFNGYQAGELSFGGPLTEISVNTVYTTIDPIVTKFSDIDKLVSLFNPSEFSDGIWPLDRDSLGNSLINGFSAISTVTTYPEILNGELVFSGSDMLALQNIEMANYDSYTIFMRINPDTASAVAGTDGVNEPSLQIDTDDFRYNNTIGTSWSGTTIDQRLVLVKTGSNLIVWRDGSIVSGPTSISSLSESQDILTIGGYSDQTSNNSFYDGNMKVFGFYSKALSTKEIELIDDLMSEL